jgi:hypothetical protein
MAFGGIPQDFLKSFILKFTLFFTLVDAFAATRGTHLLLKVTHGIRAMRVVSIPSLVYVRLVKLLIASQTGEHGGSSHS